MQTLDHLLARNKATSIFLYVTGAILTGILAWGFIMSIQQGLSGADAIKAMPTQLEVMWGAIIGLIAGGHEEEINKVERALGVDLDRDGDIGLAGSNNSPALLSSNAVGASEPTQANVPTMPIATVHYHSDVNQEPI